MVIGVLIGAVALSLACAYMVVLTLAIARDYWDWKIGLIQLFLLGLTAACGGYPAFLLWSSLSLTLR